MSADAIDPRPGARSAYLRNTTREPFGNMHFRLEIEGMSDTGAVEVIFPEARFAVGPRRSRVVQYGTLILRRGVTRSTEWHDWWDSARQPGRPPRRGVGVALLDPAGVDARRWTFAGCEPLAYLLSPLDALGHAPLIETLELTVGGFEALVVAPRAARRKRSATG